MPRCHDCGIERPFLHKHHIIERSSGGTDDPSNLLELCANCHEDRHGGPCGGTGRGRSSSSPAARRKKSKTLKRLWLDEEYRSKTLAAQEAAKSKKDFAAIAKKISLAWTPERRAEQAERIRQIRKKKFWSTGPTSSSFRKRRDNHSLNMFD